MHSILLTHPVQPFELLCIWSEMQWDPCLGSSVVPVSVHYKVRATAETKRQAVIEDIERCIEAMCGERL